MDPFQIASLAFTFLKPLIKAGAEEVSKESGKDLWISIKTLFTKNNKEQVIDEVINAPNKEEALEIMLDEMRLLISGDKQLKQAIEGQLNNLIKRGIYQKVTGDYTITIGHVNKSTISINQSHTPSK